MPLWVSGAAFAANVRSCSSVSFTAIAIDRGRHGSRPGRKGRSAWEAGTQTAPCPISSSRETDRASRVTRGIIVGKWLIFAGVPLAIIVLGKGRSCRPLKFISQALY